MRHEQPTILPLDVTSARGFQVYRTLARDGAYEPEVFALTLDRLAHADRALFINVGANLGLFPLAAARLNALGSARIDIYAHEPLPRLQKAATKLQQRNGLSYDLSPVALSDASGTADFYVSARSDTSNSLTKGFRPAKEVIQVELGTLDETHLARARATAYDEVLLMVDVETAEPAVLNGGREFLTTVRPTIICEVLAGRTEDAINTILGEVDYAAYRYDGTQWVAEPEVRGDREHTHRDWLFVPREKAPELGASFAVPATYEVSFTY